MKTSRLGRWGMIEEDDWNWGREMRRMRRDRSEGEKNMRGILEEKRTEEDEKIDENEGRV